MIETDLTFAEANADQEFIRLAYSARARRIRTLRQFAEQEIVLPEGRYAGLPFRCNRQPFAGLLLDELPKWRRSAVTGCVQSGKSLTAWVIPILYHLFELNEPVIAGVPTIDQANDKWVKELLPVIDRNAKFRSMIPSQGRGSRGGKLESITFGNGATLKFMSGGGGDEKRSSYTSRVIVVTEADKMDDQAETSREADRISQLEARTASYGEDARVYLECTVSFKQGRIWREYVAGSESRIVSQCPHCREWVAPGRDDLHGWQQASTEVEAAHAATFGCPFCGEAISDQQRAAMAAGSRLLHRGQTIDADGTVTGELPPTMTLGFRWSAFDNLFWSAAWLGAKAWRKMRSDDEDNTEKEACQFVWCTPYEASDAGDVIPLTVETVIERQAKFPRGVVPDDAKWITIGIDIGKRLAHWCAMCFLADTGHVHDYGRIEIASDDLGFDRAVSIALADFHERLVASGWSRTEYHAVLVDSRWKTDAVLAAINSLKDKRWRPAQGLGDAHYQKRQYVHPDKVCGDVLAIGHHWFERLQKLARTRIVMMDANYWKSQIHERLTLPFQRAQLTASPKGITVFSSLDPNEHVSFAKHLTAEREVLKFEPGRGHVKVWEAMREANHWLDAAYMALVAGVRCGFEKKPKATPLKSYSMLASPGGDDQRFGGPVFLEN